MFAKKTGQSLLAALLTSVALLGATTNAFAENSENRGPSGKIAMGTMSILAAPGASLGAGNGNPVVGLSAVGLGSAFIITGIVEGGGDSVAITMKGIGNSATATVNLSKSAMQSLALSTGNTVQLSAEASGTVLVVSGKVIAFIPNELGKALLGQSRVPDQ